MIRPNGSRKYARQFLLVCALSLQCASAQQCYWQDGSTASGQSECVISGEAFSQCCPQGWTCLANGLCQDKQDNFLGRYSCVDKAWGSSCPNFCLDDGFTGKDQAVLQCSDGQYCCDGDGSSGNCCNDGATRFTLAAIGQSPETSVSGGSSSSAPASSSAPPSSSASPTSSQPASSPSASSAASSSSGPSSSSNGAQQSNSVITTTSASTESASGRPVSTITFTAATISNSPNNSTASHPSSSNHKSLIIGLAVGIPVGLAVLAIPFLFLLFRRHRKRSLVQKERRRTQVADAYSGEKDSEPKSPVMPEYANDAGFYSARHVQRPSEMDGRSAGGYQAVNSVPAELSAEPQTTGLPETAAMPEASPSQRRMVGGLAYTHRPHSGNPQAYPAELPSPT